MSTRQGFAKFTRRTLLTRGVPALFAGAGFMWFNPFGPKKIRGEIVGASSRIGHLIRDQKFGVPSVTEDTETVIIGGGVAGLSAAWWLQRNGAQEFKLLELEPDVGGNSRSGQNDISAYPWGAHYLPLPGPEATFVQELLKELKVIEGYNEVGLPIYNEAYLCADPHERLYFQGRWQDGLIPQRGISESDRKQYAEFFSLVEKLKVTKGKDGRRPFVIPVDLSSQDDEFLELDKITMAEFMVRNKWDSPYLNWYVNYCCRDDYGARHDVVSAWAGLHYFASRVGVGANADSQTVLTWPEGNGWLVKKLRSRVAENVRVNSLVVGVQNHANGVFVDFLDTQSLVLTRLNAKKALFAAPRFIARKLIPQLNSEEFRGLQELQYSPWMVANTSLRSRPEGRGAPLSWDNVNFYSQSLGYVVANHQGLSLFPTKTVLTSYFPLSELEPGLARQHAFHRKYEEWAEIVVKDLEQMHPGIREMVERVDIHIWGHGMVIPKVGYVTGKTRKIMQRPIGNIHFANSDMSGVSIFEEAQYRGIKGAQKILLELGRTARGLT